MFDFGLQMYRGFIRQLAPCAAFLPQAWASRLNGMDKDMVLELFWDYVDGTELAWDMTCVEFDKVRDLLRDRYELGPPQPPLLSSHDTTRSQPKLPK